MELRKVTKEEAERLELHNQDSKLNDVFDIDVLDIFIDPDSIDGDDIDTVYIKLPSKQDEQHKFLKEAVIWVGQLYADDLVMTIYENEEYIKLWWD